ncbi:MAG: nitroreductase [Deltaproteobacteria bacterium HGW-Deltaproteobacteria-6]|jgi:nitroreductase|nr:MAG: nitroreductase [Deltaproteobacteria bacterium HGW-Deltaproteobacteria-6]
MELQEAIRKRRSVRRFTDDFVTDDELKNIFEAVRWSPSWSNTQAWEFIVVRDRDLIAKVVASYAGKNPATKCSLAASALIVVCAKTGVSGCYGGQDVTKHANWYMFDLGIATQTLCLTAHEMGLGTVVVGLMDHDACRKVISLPVGYEVAAVIPVGRRTLEAKEGPARKTLSDMVHLDQFGKKMFE